MQKKAWTYTMIATVAGAVGVMVRWLQCMTIFEEETGLATPHSPLSLLTGILLAVIPAVLWVYTGRIDASAAPEEPEDALMGKGATVSAIFAGAAVICLGGAALLFLSADTKLLHAAALLGILSVPAAAMMSSFPRWGGVGAFLAVIPVFFFSVWLVSLYKDNAANPSVWVYCVQILAIAACLLASFRVSGYLYYRAKPRKAVFACGLALAYCLTVLMDDAGTGARILFAGWGIVYGVTGWLLLANLREPEPEYGEEEY